THLKRMDLMLGYKPTQISMNSLIEATPTKKLSNLAINTINDRVCSAVRRERPHSPAPYILSPPIEVPLSDIDKYMIRHDWKCKCIFCDIVQVKVYAFILGCFYARILFLNENYTESYKFYHKAINYWHTLKESVSSSKDHTLYKNFMFYSLQIHMHICHCLIEMKKYDELKGVCNSIKDLLQENVWNDEAIIEECNFTIKIATETEFTLKTTPEKKFQSYDEFITDSDIQAILSPVPVPTSLNQVSKSSKHIPIFVDLQKGAKLSPAHKKRLFFSKKKTTLESMDLQGLCVGKKFDLGFKIAGAFKIDMYDLNFEITTESVVFVMTVIQQWVWFHFKGGKKEANQNLRLIVLENLKNILPFATPKDYVMIINKFLGSSSNLAAPLTQLKNGPELLKLIIKELFEFPIKLDAASENVVISNLPGYVKVLLGLQTTEKSLKEIEFYMLEKVQKKISNTQIIDFLNATCKLINDPSLENLNSVSSLLTEIAPKVNGTSNSKATSSIECCLIIAKFFKQIVQTISQTLESSSFVILFKFVMSLIAVLRNCDSETNRGYCSECTNTKRHVAVLLIQTNLNVFNSYFRNQTVNAELISHLTEHISYQMVTAEGLQCKYKEQYLENSLIFIYTTIVQESHLTATEYLKYRLKLIKVFEKYFKGRNVSILTPQRVLVLYSKVYTLDENPQKHLSALALLILTETSHIYKISRADQVVKKRSSVVEFAEKSILQIIQQAKEEGFEAGELQSYNEVDIILLEMENIFKYSKNYERNVGLFNDLLSRTSDPLILGHALFLFELDEHNKIPENVIERIETDLKKIQPKTMLSEAILGLIVMRKYANEYNRDKETLKEVKFFGVSKSDKEDLNKNFEMLTIKSEHNTVKLLDEALKHYSMALNIASRDKYKPLDELYSCVKIRRSIDTIALQYEQRGLHKQAMEAQHLSYVMAKAKEDEMGILIALSYFVENMKQYDELFKPNPKMIKTLNDSLQKFMENIDNLALYKKGFIYSAQLSLVSHYIDNGSLSEGQELLVLIDSVLNDIEDKKTMSYFLILRFKALFLHLKLITEHNKSLSISTSAFAALIIAELNDTVEYKDEFQSCMPNMLFKMIEYIGYYQAARYDSKMMQNYIHLLFKIGAKKGMEIRCMQSYLTLTYTDLIEDNLSDVEMAEMYKRCLEKWEQNAATSDASTIKTQIEKYFQVAIKKEETRSNAARKIFGILVPHISDANASNLVEIFRYLISQSPQYMFKYFLPLLFNKVLELEKT
uniref:CSON008958 protein n=1 Tax=Culicoides sonorensis TaxID=179676 RepID=A0A336N2J1_CULSO